MALHTQCSSLNTTPPCFTTTNILDKWLSLIACIKNNDNIFYEITLPWFYLPWRFSQTTASGLTFFCFVLFRFVFSFLFFPSIHTPLQEVAHYVILRFHATMQTCSTLALWLHRTHCILDAAFSKVRRNLCLRGLAVWILLARIPSTHLLSIFAYHGDQARVA